MENNKVNAMTPKAEPENEGAKVIQMLRLLNGEDQRIAYAVLEGMKLQKAINNQGAAAM